MTFPDLQRKNWLVPFLRDIPIPPPPTGESEASNTWHEEALRARGLLLGEVVEIVPKPLKEKKREQGQWILLNTLQHQVELFYNTQRRLNPQINNTQLQLNALSALAALHGDFLLADQIYDLNIDQQSPNTSALTPLACQLGKKLLDTSPHRNGIQFTTLPFQKIVTYTDTCCLLEIAKLFISTSSNLGISRPDPQTLLLLVQQARQKKVHLVEAIIALARADGRVSRSEKNLIKAAMNLARLSRDERRLIRKLNQNSPSPEEIGALFVDPLTQRFIFEQMLLYSLLDHEQHPDEKEFLRRFGISMGLSQETLLLFEVQTCDLLSKHQDLLQKVLTHNPLVRYQKNLAARAEEILTLNLKRILTEIRETQELSQLLLKRINSKLTEEEERRVRAQLTDICKTIPSLAIFAIPGGSFVLPILLKILPFNLLPSAFSETEEHL